MPPRLATLPLWRLWQRLCQRLLAQLLTVAATLLLLRMLVLAGCGGEARSCMPAARSANKVPPPACLLRAPAPLTGW